MNELITQCKNTVIKEWAQVINTDSPQLNTASKHTSEQNVIDFIIIEVQGLVDFFTLKYNMNAIQVGDTAELIYESYPFYRLNDIKFFFREAKKGKFGKVWDRLDGNMVLEWLKIYELERTEKIVESNNKKEDEINKGFDGPFLALKQLFPDIKPRIGEGKYDWDKHKRMIEAESMFKALLEAQGSTDNKILYEGQRIDSSTYIHLKTKP